MASFFPYGTQYHRAPTPLPEEWAGDLKRIAEIGYTHVQYRPQWRWHESVRGQYVFDDLDRLFDLAEDNGLRVVLKPMLETAPDWAFQELGGTRVGFHGVPISPVAIGAFYVGGWLPCFDNPAVSAAANAFVGQLVQRYRQHPALWFYDAWNEPRSRPLGQCHCEHSVRSYQDWLQERFGSIEQINDYLGKRWTSLRTIRPPASAGDYVEMYLWRQWAAHAVAEHVRVTAETIRQADPDRTVLAHVGFCSVLQDPACDASDDLLVAAKADRYGTSFPVNLWPKQGMDDTQPDLISDWMRRVDPQYWCHEFYPNEANWCEPPEPRVLERLIWMALAGGTAGFTFWQYRSERLGNESNGWGMREINGEPTARSEVCDRIAGILREHGAKLAGTHRPAAPVALMYSRSSDLLGRVEAMARCEQDPMQEAATSEYAYKQALHSAHFLYQALGYTTDLVTPGDDLTGRAVVHVSAMEMVDEASAAQLIRYVEAGGTLIIEHPFACRDERTWVALERPMHGLAQRLGWREAARVALGAERQAVRFESGRVVEAVGTRVDLDVMDGRPIGWWSDGAIAAVCHRLGAGMVCTLGINLSLSAGGGWDDAAMDVLNDLLCDSGMEREYEADRGLLVRRRVGAAGEIWFVFNIGPRAAELTLPAEPDAIWHESDVARSDQRLTVPPGGSWVAAMPLRSASDVDQPD